MWLVRSNSHWSRFAPRVLGCHSRDMFCACKAESWAKMVADSKSIGLPARRMKMTWQADVQAAAQAAYKLESKSLGYQQLWPQWLSRRSIELLPPRSPSFRAHDDRWHGPICMHYCCAWRQRSSVKLGEDGIKRGGKASAACSVTLFVYTGQLDVRTPTAWPVMSAEIFCRLGAGSHGSVKGDVLI